MKDVSGVVKVVERIDSDVKETNIWIDRRTKELKQLESRFDNLADHLVFLEQANIEKEGRIDDLEGVIQSMSDKLCRFGDREVSSVLVEAGTEEPMVEEAEGSQLEYAEDDEYHTRWLTLSVKMSAADLAILELGGGQLVLAQPRRRTNPLWRTSFQFQSEYRGQRS